MNAPPRSKGLTLIKTSVIVMGVLIFLGVIALVYGLVTRTGSMVGAAAPPNAADAVVMRLGLPPETQVRAMAVHERTLALQLAIPGQGEWVYIVPLAGEGRILKIAISAGETKP